MQLYARTEHGGHRVLSNPSGFEVHWPEGPKNYRSARRAIMALVNRDPNPKPTSRDPHLCFDRYFRIGRYARETFPQLDTLSLFKPNEELAVIARPNVLKNSDVLIVHKPLGIDLYKMGNDVRKLFYAGFGRSVSRKGYDPDDVLQDVYKALLVRNAGKCPWDPAKSTFGHYVHMVCRGVVSNYYRRYSRVSDAEHYGTFDFGEVIDVAASSLAKTESPFSEIEARSERSFVSETIMRKAKAEGRDVKVVAECLKALSEGYKQREIAEMLSLSAHKVYEVVHWIRNTAREAAAITRISGEDLC